jgi:hypothetical protein
MLNLPQFDVLYTDVLCRRLTVLYKRSAVPIVSKKGQTPLEFSNTWIQISSIEFSRR